MKHSGPGPAQDILVGRQAKTSPKEDGGGGDEGGSTSAALAGALEDEPWGRWPSKIAVGGYEHEWVVQAHV